MKKVLLFSILLAAPLVTFMVIKRFGASSSSQYISSDRKQKIQRKTISSELSYVANVAPIASQAIYPRVSGRIQDIFVKESEWVTEGQNIMRIKMNRTMYLAAELLRSDVRKIEHDLKNLLDELKEYEENKELFTRSQINKLKFQINQKKEILTDAQLRLDNFFTSRSLSLDPHDLEYVFIRSPMDGFIANLMERTGSDLETFEQASSQPLFYVVNDKKVLIKFDVMEVDYKKIQVGQKLNVMPEKLEGHILQIGSRAIVKPGNIPVFPVVAEALNEDRVLKPSTNHVVKIPLETKENVLAIPLSALYIFEDRYFVEKYIEGQIKIIPVQVGVSDRAWIEVISDRLQENDIVLRADYEKIDKQKLSL